MLWFKQKKQKKAILPLHRIPPPKKKATESVNHVNQHDPPTSKGQDKSYEY